MHNLIEQAIAIQQIPAPTFAEQARAAYLLDRFRALGLSDIEMDERSTVYGRLPGRDDGPAVMVSAHLDTVFPAESDLTLRWEGDHLYGPGIGDNSLGVASLLTLAELLAEVERPRDLWFVANVGEEGLGDLNGMRAAVARLRERLGACIVIEGGTFGSVIHGGIGVERRRLTVECEGGHSWSDFGRPSAIHVLGQIVAEIAGWEVPSRPRTSYNVGRIEGGTSINTIAARAHAELDLRSAGPDALDALVARLDELIARFDGDGVRVRSEVIGSRPPGRLAEEHPLVQAAIASLHGLGVAEVNHGLASTDANIPLALGIPALCIGLTRGHNAHRLDEYIETAPLGQGMRHATEVILAALAWLDEGGAP